MPSINQWRARLEARARAEARHFKKKYINKKVATMINIHKKITIYYYYFYIKTTPVVQDCTVKHSNFASVAIDVRRGGSVCFCLVRSLSLSAKVKKNCYNGSTFANAIVKIEVPLYYLAHDVYT